MADVDITTYSDDPALGAAAPSLDPLEPVHGTPQTLQPQGTYVVYFFTTFYKGAYVVNEEVTCLSERYAEHGVTVIAISNDAERERLDRFLAKTIVDENTKAPLRLQVPHLAFDGQKATAKRYAGLSKLAIMSCPSVYIVHNGCVVWRQVFTQSFTLKDSDFEVQLQHVLKGEPLESNGPRPVSSVVDEGEEAEVDEMSLF